MRYSFAILAATAGIAAASNAHFKVDFYGEEDCNSTTLKPGNLKDPSDLSPSKNECETPDHHLKSGGFDFKSIKFWFKGDDWKDDKFRNCTLEAYHESLCGKDHDEKHPDAAPAWSAPLGESLLSKKGPTCMNLTSEVDQVPFLSLQLNCPWDAKKAKESTVESTFVGTQLASIVFVGSTFSSESSQSSSESVTIFPTTSELVTRPSPDTIEIRPTETMVSFVDGDVTTVRPQATATFDDLISARTRLHARDVTARGSPCFSSSCPYSPDPSSVEVVIDEQDFFNLITKLGEDLGEWIEDLQDAVDEIEGDSMPVDCHEDSCRPMTPYGDCQGNSCDEIDEMPQDQY